MELNDIFTKLFEQNSCTTLKMKFKSRLEFSVHKNGAIEGIDFSDLNYEESLKSEVNSIWYATCKRLNKSHIDSRSENVYLIFKSNSNIYKYDVFVNDSKVDSKKIENLFK